MKKVFILVSLLASAFIVNAQVQTPPYSSTMVGANSGWTVINTVEGSSTWEDDDYSRDFRNTPFTEGKEYRYDRNNEADDWLISPAISLEAGKEYKVSFWGKAYSDMECYSFSMAKENTIEALSTEGAILYDYDHVSMDWEKISQVIVPETSGEYFFGFHAYSPKDRNYIYLTGFEVKENVFAPAPVSDLTVTPDIGGALIAEIKWSLPTLDSDGATIPADAIFNKIDIYRDNKLIGELPGNDTGFTDTEALGLTGGKHTYGVIVTVNGVPSSMVEVESRYIGSLPVYTLPWTAGISSLSDEDFKTFFAVIKGQRSTVPSEYGWSLKNGRIQFDPRSMSKREDDWLILPKVKFETPGVYRVRVKAEYSGDINPDLGVYIGTERSIEGMANHVGTFTTLPSSSAEKYVAFEITEAGEFYVAFYAGRDEAGSSKKMFFDDIYIERTEALPEAIADLTATVKDDIVTLSWTAPALMNTGKDITAIDKIIVYRNDDVIAEIVENIVPGKQMEYVDIPSESGIFTYVVIPVVDGKQPDTAPKSVTTSWIGDSLQDLPYDLDFSKSVDLTLQKSFWTIYNNDKDSYTWSISSSGITLSLDTYDGGETNDMLVSPPFVITPGKYFVKLKIKGGESGFPLQVGFVAEDDDSHSVINPVIIELNGKNSYAEYAAEIDTMLDGRHCLAINSNAEYDYDPYNVVINRIQLERNHTSVCIESVATDNIDTEYFDLTGMKISNPQHGSIYLVRNHEGKVQKIIY